MYKGIFYGGNFRFFLCVERRQGQLEIKSNSFYREFICDMESLNPLIACIKSGENRYSFFRYCVILDYIQLLQKGTVRGTQNSCELTDIMIVCEGAFMSCPKFYTTLAGKIKTTKKVTRITK